MKSKIKQISIVVSPEIIKKLDEGNYNKNKLINDLIEKYFQKTEK